jgi:hypothetical protein
VKKNFAAVDLEIPLKKIDCWELEENYTIQFDAVVLFNMQLSFPGDLRQGDEA